MSEQGQVAESKRAKVTEKDWIKRGENGEVVITKDAREAEGVRIKILGSGTDARDYFAGDYPEPVQMAFRAFGLDTVLTNTIGNKELSADDKVEAMEARHETFMAGEWTSRKGGEGPRISLLAQAVVRAFGKAGETRDLEATAGQLRSAGEEGRKAILATPAIKAEYELIRAELAAERAKKAQAEAEGGEEADGGLSALSTLLGAGQPA